MAIANCIPLHNILKQKKKKKDKKRHKHKKHRHHKDKKEREKSDEREKSRDREKSREREKSKEKKDPNISRLQMQEETPETLSSAEQSSSNSNQTFQDMTSTL